MTSLCHLIFMISWTPTTSAIYVLFLMASTFAFTDALASSQVRAAFGIFFPDNKAAYSALFIFETIGLVVGSVLSNFVCVYVKIYVFIGLSAVCLITYILLEIKTSYKKSQVFPKIDNLETVLKNSELRF